MELRRILASYDYGANHYSLARWRNGAKDIYILIRYTYKRDVIVATDEKQINMTIMKIRRIIRYSVKGGWEVDWIRLIKAYWR